MHGPRNAPIAFIGAVSSDTDKARREPMTGPAGYVFKKLYLQPLRLTKEDVLLANIDGSPEPIKAYLDSLPVKPFVVALSHHAKSELGDDYVDFVLPHPDVVYRLGDSGEVGRKMRRVKKILMKQEELGDEGGDIATKSVEQHWDNNWHKMLPRSGKGQFVYQRHWHNLTDEQVGLGDSELLHKGGSLHGDLRFEGEGGLFGWAVLLGSAVDNRKFKTDDKLLEGESVRSVVKPKHSRDWLKVGGDNGQVFNPGEPGANKDSFSKIFTRDLGTYEIGVVKQDSVELFLDGRELKGRYLISREGNDNNAPWLLSKPEDQTPILSRESLEDNIRELRQKRNRFLFWGKPGEVPQRIDVKSGAVIKSKQVPIFKTDEEKKIVYGVVLDPYQPGGGDAHGDFISPKEIERTAHEWMAKSRMISLNHEREAEGAVPVESWVEQYPSRKDYLAAQKGEPHRAFRREYGADVLHSGAWVLGTRLSDELWEDFKAGEIEAYSIEGFGVRVPMSRDDLPEVTFVDLVEVNTSVEQP